MAPEIVETVRQWATALRNTKAGSEEADSTLAWLAGEIQADRERVRHGADARFTTLYRFCPVGVVLVDAEGLVVAANPAFAHLTGSKDDRRFLGEPVANVAGNDHSRTVLGNALASAEKSNGKEQIEITATGDLLRVVMVTFAALPGDNSGHLVLIFEDVHELRMLQRTFQYQSLHDPLTGLPNGTHFRSKLEAMLADGADEQIALLFLDIDGFKVISDGLGDDHADRVLRGVADTLRKVFGQHKAFIGRLFNDEFAVALRGALHATTVIELTEQAIEELAKPLYVDDVGVGVSTSIGIVVADMAGAVHTELINSADVALHRAKDLGRSQWVLFDREVGKEDRDRYRLACAIAGALETGEITVTYQPHAVLPDARIVTSVNAALCWTHPTSGTLRSDDIHALAELTGMSVPLGKHLLSEAMQTSADWRSRFGADSPMVCLTLPRRMAIDADLVGMVNAALRDNALAPEHFMLCADGGSLSDDRGDLLESIGHLARLGILFVLNIGGLPELELIPALRVPAPAVMLAGRIVDALAVDTPPRWAARNLRQLVERAEELGVKVGAYDVRSAVHARRLFDLGVVVASGPYLPEHNTRAEAEVWVGHTFPMG